MGTSRALGGLLCVATILVAILHLYFGYISGGSGAWARGALAFALPITVGIIAVCGLGCWLGWIMLSTKEVSSPAPAKPKEESKGK